MVNPAVDFLHSQHDEHAAAQDEQLLPQKMGRRAGRMGVVGHLGGRRIDHQHRNHRQRRHDDPQHPVAREKAELGSLGRIGEIFHSQFSSTHFLKSSPRFS